MDRILKQLLNNFLTDYEIEADKKEETDFEKFVAYSIVSNEYNRDFEWESVWTGKGGDTALDGVAIIVNGKLIESQGDIDFLIEHNHKLDVTFVFIQTTITASFDSSKMSWFGTGVEDFFDISPKFVRNEKIEQLATLAKYLYDKTHLFERNPVCKLYYVCTGVWSDDKNNVGAKKKSEDQLRETGFFSSVSFEPLGSSGIVKLYQKTKNRISASFVFKNRVTLPELLGVREAYYGILPFSEFAKILVDENNHIRNIFYDNIRDFYGDENPINSKIAETLNGPVPDLFTVLNNGITVVSSEISPTGDKFTITDFSIVNGCQTSNVLSLCLSKPELQDLGIPLKLIITTNDEIKNQITIATNSQNSVKREQLQAVTDFQKNLEEFYTTFRGDDRLYYEGRPNQYRTNSFPKAKIISIPIQIKAFGAMFLNIPDRVTSYFGYVIKEFVEGENKQSKIFIFHPDHKPIIYYTAALAYYQLERLFKTKKIDSKYKKFKFFILALFGKLVSATALPAQKMNSEKEVKKICDPILVILRDPGKTLNKVNLALEIIDQSGLDLNDKETLKNVSTTTTLNKEFDKKYPELLNQSKS